MEIKSYVESINGTPVLLDKITKVIELSKKICPEELKDIFISEFKTANGNRKNESLYIFSDNYMMESKNIMSADINLDITYIKDYIDYYQITSRSYDYKNTNENSILKIEGNLGNIVFNLNATNNNCNKLWQIFNTYIKPNLYTEILYEEEVS